MLKDFNDYSDGNDVITEPTRDHFIDVCVDGRSRIFHQDAIILISGPWKHQKLVGEEDAAKLVTMHMGEVFIPLLRLRHMASDKYDLTHLQYISPPITCNFPHSVLVASRSDGRDTGFPCTPMLETA